MTPWLLVAIALLIAAVLTQVLVPRLGERRIERHLAGNGGEAFVAIAAMPALRLLRGTGDRILVRGRRLAIGMSTEGGGLTALDGFAEVDIALRDFSTGPFEVAYFELTRNGDGPYLMRSEAVTSGVALAGYSSEQIGGLALLLHVLAKQAPLGSRGVPVSVEVELTSAEGMVSISSGGGTIAGYPAGPIAAMIAAAVARRLEISY
ncbi:MAG: hypothetical protein WBC01_04240 [Solirubrobacterales bacterium]